MPRFLVRIQPTRPEMLTASTPEEDQIVEAHFAYLQDLADRDVVLLAGQTLNTDPSSFGIVVLTVPSEASALEIVNGGSRSERRRLPRGTPPLPRGTGLGETSRLGEHRPFSNPTGRGPRRIRSHDWHRSSGGRRAAEPLGRPLRGRTTGRRTRLRLR